MASDPNAPVSPISPPMLSPDKKWVWDGSQWQPVADPRDPAHHSVFAAFSDATQNLPIPVADARPMPGPPPMTVAAPVPLNVARPKRSKAQAGVAVLWDRRSTGINRYLYYAAGAIAVVIVIVVALQFGGDISLPNRQGDGGQPQPSSGPPGLKTRAASSQADRYMNGILFPALNNANSSIQLVQQGCTAAMTVSCASTIPEADRDLKKVVATIDDNASLVPLCIAPGVASMKFYLLSMDQDLVGAQKASDNNQMKVVASDLAGWRYYLHGLAAAERITTGVEMPSCDPTVTGPAA